MGFVRAMSAAKPYLYLMDADFEDFGEGAVAVRNGLSSNPMGFSLVGCILVNVCGIQVELRVLLTHRQAYHDVCLLRGIWPGFFSANAFGNRPDPPDAFKRPSHSP